MALRQSLQTITIRAFTRYQVDRVDTAGVQLRQQRNDPIVPFVSFAAIEARDRQDDGFLINRELAARRSAVARGESGIDRVVDDNHFFGRNPCFGERSGARITADRQHEVGGFERGQAAPRNIVPDFGAVQLTDQLGPGQPRQPHRQRAMVEMGVVDDLGPLPERKRSGARGIGELVHPGRFLVDACGQWTQFVVGHARQHRDRSRKTAFHNR